MAAKSAERSTISTPTELPPVFSFTTAGKPISASTRSWMRPRVRSGSAPAPAPGMVTWGAAPGRQFQVTCSQSGVGIPAERISRLVRPLSMASALAPAPDSA